MWFEIKKDVYNECSNIEEFRKLIQDLCYKHKFNFFLDITQIEDMDLFDKIYDTNCELIYAYYNSFINGKYKIDYSISNIDKDSFDISDAIKFINIQFIIFLENSDNDGHFLNSLIREFKSNGKKILKHKSENWLKYQMAGGAENIKHCIESEINHYKGDLRFLKCFVLFDSDKSFPEEVILNKQSLISYLESKDIHYHFLEKREIENYLPIEQFEQIDSTHKFIKTYVNSLNEVQKDYIDIQHGFQKDRKEIENKQPKIYELYSNLTDESFKNLRNGIDSRFSNFKTEYSLLFKQVTKEGLIERTKKQNNPNELQDILDKINNLL